MKTNKVQMPSRLTFAGIMIYLLCGFTVNAGDTREWDKKNSFWSEFVFIQPINDKWKVQMDFQYRTQSDEQYYQPNPNLSNIFLHPYQTVFRPWIHYYPTKKVRFSISPIGYWMTYGLAGMPGVVSPPGVAANKDFLRTPELRTCLQATLYDQIGRVSFQQRYRLEFRWTGNKQPSLISPDDALGSFNLSPGNLLDSTTNRLRFRYFIRAMVALKGNTIDENEFYVPIQNEIFLGIGDNVKNVNAFDQNRSYIGLGFKTKNKILIELAYLNQIQTQKMVTVGSNNVLHMDFNNVFQLWMCFEDVGSLFRKKAKKVDPSAAPEPVK